MSFVLAIDQGTTSSRAIVFRSDISIAAVAQQEFPQHFPASGWVEHEPHDIWTSTVMVCRDALEKAGLKAKDIAAIGITNQRETAGAVCRFDHARAETGLPDGRRLLVAGNA